MRTSAASIIALVAWTGIAGCAVERRVPEAPQAPESPVVTSIDQPGADEPQDIDALEAELARDESTLQSLLSPAAPPPAEEVKEAPESADAPAAGGAEAAPAQAAPKRREADRCERACRALSSMRRCAEGICRMADDEQDRCERAQSRVQDAEALIESAGCSC